jgi:predicted RNA polymerase sigma factor
MHQRQIEDLLREQAPQVLGAVVRRYGHFDLAEDAVQERLIAAAMQWPKEGIPARRSPASSDRRPPSKIRLGVDPDKDRSEGHG